MWEALGGLTSTLYSLQWRRLLRPAQSALQRASSPHGRAAALLATPVAVLADAYAAHLPRAAPPFRPGRGAAGCRRAARRARRRRAPRRAQPAIRPGVARLAARPGARQAPPRRAAGAPAARAGRRHRRLVPLLPERQHEQGAADPRARGRRARGARPSVPARLAARRGRDRGAHGAAARAHARPAALPVPQHQRLCADPLARRGAARRAGARRRVLQPAGGRMVDALRRRAARRGDRPGTLPGSPCALQPALP